MLGDTCIQKKNKKKFLYNPLLRSKSMKKMSVHVRNYSLSLKLWFGESYNFFIYNLIMSGLNTEKLLMLLKSQMVMMQ